MPKSEYEAVVPSAVTESSGTQSGCSRLSESRIWYVLVGTEGHVSLSESGESRSIEAIRKGGGISSTLNRLIVTLAAVCSGRSHRMANVSKRETKLAFVSVTVWEMLHPLVSDMRAPISTAVPRNSTVNSSV